MSDIKVSVIVPVYNSERHLRECLDSIRQQTLKDIEIICVDDGSSDGSLQILDEYENMDKRFTVLQNLTNKGTGYSINKGIRYSHGEYIAEVDADDFIDPDMYEQLYKAAKGADIVKSGYWSYYEEDKEVPSSLVEEESRFNPLKLNFKNRRDVFGFQCSFWTAIYKRELFFIDPEFTMWNETSGASFQDTSACFILTAMAKEMVWLPRSFYHWRVGEAHSITSTKWPFAVIGEYRRIENFLERFPWKQLSLRYILSRNRFGTYSWNYSRIAKEDRSTFAVAAAEDLRRDIDYIDLRYYTEKEANMFLTWAQDPEQFNQIMSKALDERTEDKE